MNINEHKKDLVLSKGRNGWQARSLIPMGFNNRHLEIFTSKRFDGYLTTSASVVKIENGALTMMLFQDYSKTLTRTKNRCTEKSVQLQHTQFDWDVAMNDAMWFYQAELQSAGKGVVETLESLGYTALDMDAVGV